MSDPYLIGWAVAGLLVLANGVAHLRLRYWRRVLQAQRQEQTYLRAEELLRHDG